MAHLIAHLPLTVQKIWNSTRGIYDIAPCENGWIVRMVARICKIDQAARILWQVEFPDEGVAMDLPVRVMNALVFMPSKKGRDDYELIALSAQDGRVVWRHRLSWTGMNTYGGLFIWGDRIFVPEKRGFVQGGSVLQSTDGVVLGALEDWPTEAFNWGIGIQNPHIAQVGRWLFMSQKVKAAYRLDLEADQKEWSLVPGIDCAILSSHLDTLAILGKHEETFAVMKVDPSTMEVLCKASIDEVEQEIGITNEIRVADADTVILLAEKGIAAIRLSNSEILWRILLEDLVEKYAGGFLVGPTFIVKTESTEGRNLLEIDWQTGAMLKSTPSKALYLNAKGWAMGEDQLLMDATAGYVLFQRKPELPTLPEAEEFFVVPAATPMPKPESPAAATSTPTDEAYSAIITAFVNAKAAQEQGREADHKGLAAEFNRLFDAFTQAHPEASIANVALTLSELGVPYEVALADVVRMRG